MDYPKMILFDYGQTIIEEEKFNRLEGLKVLLDKATKNPNNISAEELFDFYTELNIEIGREGDSNDLTPNEMDKIFWDASAPGKPVENIGFLLNFLHEKGIRTAVISNLSYSGETLKNRINTLIPNNHFEFIIASSEYMFKKPHKKIFELALRKANLESMDVWFCGDNVIADVEGASLSGIKPIWFKGALREEKYTPMVDYIEINDWIELKKLLEE
ncbi:HAD family hydrolase [Clostridium sp.]|uniref:HAD family hydrolase n=1 Tax=Clostridium sp. TaxID=1506 RepID=UPI00290FF6A9|nr:HAD family hydrolase [Clostridium sp.]MDU7004452.1 HAD family hydrolase [Clostridium sp.]